MLFQHLEGEGEGRFALGGLGAGDQAKFASVKGRGEGECGPVDGVNGLNGHGHADGFAGLGLGILYPQGDGGGEGSRLHRERGLDGKRVGGDGLAIDRREVGLGQSEGGFAEGPGLDVETQAEEWTGTRREGAGGRERPGTVDGRGGDRKAFGKGGGFITQRLDNGGVVGHGEGESAEPLGVVHHNGQGDFRVVIRGKHLGHREGDTAEVNTHDLAGEALEGLRLGVAGSPKATERGHAVRPCGEAWWRVAVGGEGGLGDTGEVGPLRTINAVTIDARLAVGIPRQQNVVVTRRGAEVARPTHVRVAQQEEFARGRTAEHIEVTVGLPVHRG